MYTSRALISSRFKFLISSLIYSSWISRNSSCLCSALRWAYKSSSSCPSNLNEGMEQKVKMRLTVKNKNKSAREEICESCRFSSQLTVDGDISSGWFQTLPLLDTESKCLWSALTNESIGTKRRRKDVVSLGAIIRENYMFMLKYVYYALLHGTMGE